MLYKRRDVRSLNGLTDWLETKDPGEKYSYGNSRDCMCAQYFRDNGFRSVSIGVYHFRHGVSGLIEERLPPGFNEVAQGSSGNIFDNTCTFGDALQRARKILSK